MADIQEAKKELLDVCDQCVALFGGKPLSGDVNLINLNGKMFAKLQEVLKEGSIKDQEEALKAFARVIKAFKDGPNPWNHFSPKQARAKLKDNPYFGQKEFDKMQKLQDDLLKLVEGSTENG